MSAIFIGLLLLMAACSNIYTSYVLYANCGVDDSDVLLSDWADYEIVVNNRGLYGVSFQTVGESGTPTHVPLRVIAEELGADISIQFAVEEISNECSKNGVILASEGEHVSISLTLYGKNGRIILTDGSESFEVNGEFITIYGLPTVVIDYQLHVPIQFFSNVFGIANAYYSNGHVYIYD